MTGQKPLVECVIPILRVADLGRSLDWYASVLGFKRDWGADAASPGLGGSGNTVSGNIQLSGDNFPADAQAIVTAAGLEAAYADLKMNP